MNDQQLAAKRAVLTDDQLWDIRNRVAIEEVTREDDSKTICVKHGRAIETAILAALAQREPVAEAEVQRYSPAIYRSATSDSKPIMKPNNFGDYVYLPDWQRTEAARLAAEERASRFSDLFVRAQGDQIATDQLNVRLQARLTDLEDQLAAERERSEKLASELSDEKDMNEYSNRSIRELIKQRDEGLEQLEYIRERNEKEFKAAIEAYQSSKENGK